MTNKKNTPNSQGKLPKPNGGAESDDLDLGMLNDEIEIESPASGSNNRSGSGRRLGGISGGIGDGVGSSIGGQNVRHPGKNMHTLLTRIADDPAWRDRARCNEFANRIAVKQPFPPHDAGTVLGFAAPAAGGDWRALDDAALLETVAYFQGPVGFGWATKSLVTDALEAARHTRYGAILGYAKAAFSGGRRLCAADPMLS
jgi:hypothetical protein